MGVCSHGFVALFVTIGVLVFFYVLCEEEEEGEKRGDIKYNEKDTFIPIFTDEKGEVGNGGLTEVTSSGLSDSF